MSQKRLNICHFMYTSVFTYSVLLLACVMISPVQVFCDALVKLGFSCGLGLSYFKFSTIYISARFINMPIDFIIKNGD
jgi:hypothetical protein